MSEIAEFVAAVRADPDDDRPRLVFADWLEERGDEPRARFVRLQVEAARHPWGTRRRIDTLREAEDLRLEHEDAWLGPWRDRLVRWRWHRGFVAEATVTGATFDRHAIELFGEHLVDRIGFCDDDGDPLGADAVPAIVGHPAFVHVRSLDILGVTPVRSPYGGWHSEFRDPPIPVEEWLREIAANESLTAFREYRPGASVRRYNNFDDDSGVDPTAIEAFCRAPHLGNVTSLDLRGCPLAESGGRDRIAALVAEAPFARNLVRLGIEPWKLGDEAVLRIAGDAVFGRLRHVDMAGYGANVSPSARDSLFHSETLGSLRCMEIGEDELDAYSRSPLARRIRSLTIAGGEGGEPHEARASWRRIVETAEPPRILSWVCYDPGREVIADLRRSPWLRRVRSFVIRNDSQSPGLHRTDGIARLLRSNSFPRLTRLRLHEFADRTFREALADWPGVARLEQLELTDDYFGRFATPLFESPVFDCRLERLSQIYVGEDADVEAIATARVVGVRELDLGFGIDLDPTAIRRVFDCPMLANVETLRLGFNPYEPTTQQMPAKVYRVLADAAVLPRLQTVCSWLSDDEGALAALRTRLGAGLKQ